ncbi:MAG: glycosyltransferase family 4 protein [Candidatus Thermoplasmatota archaeon]|nr:glycosyltransferase family 4 protein [Candidatus Thermoplasmatota archaeon]
MKICFIASTRAESVHEPRWIQWFVNRGHDVHVITPTHNDIKGAKIYPIGNNKEGSLFNFISKIFQTRKLVKKIKPDILHAHYIFGPGVFGAFSGFHPFILTAFGSDILVDPSLTLKKIAVTHTLKKADAITCDACHLKESMEKLGADDRKINIIYFGTDTEKFNPKQHSEKTRKNLGVLNAPTIISSKNLEPIYDIDSLIRSVPIVLKKVPEAKFIIAGEGSQKAKLMQLAKSLGVSGSVKFIGFIPSDEFPRYLVSADIYVCTSLSDGGLAVATKEAMACELPVVVTNLDVNTKWVENGKNGFVVPLKDPKTLSEKIIYLIEHEDVRRKFGEKGRKLVEEKFEYDKEMKKVENIYEQLINNHKRRK